MQYPIIDGQLKKALSALVDVALTFPDGAPCLDGTRKVPGCCEPGAYSFSAQPGTVTEDGWLPPPRDRSRPFPDQEPEVRGNRIVGRSPPRCQVVPSPRLSRLPASQPREMAVHDTAGRVMVIVPSAVTTDSLEISPTRFGCSSVFCA